MSPVPTEPIMLNASQVEAGACLLARAFQNDPLMVYFVPSTQKRRHLLPVLFRVVVQYCLCYGAVYTTSGLDGLACCLPPGQTKTISRLALTSFSSGIPVQLGLVGLQRFLHASRYTGQAHKQAAPGVHWYIWALGIDLERQGYGFGSQLLQKVQKRALAEAMPCYLDTQNPRNVPFYQRHGFRQVSETTIAGSDVHVYVMLWEPDEASLLVSSRVESEQPGFTRSDIEGEISESRFQKRAVP
jgi:ribosomal protein S18 acetylase RimI-like enzyme